MLNKLFVSAVRVKILKTMLLNPDKSLHVRAIVRSVGAEINAIRRELDNLISIDLLRKRQSSNRIYYTVNTFNAFFPELLALVAKEDGLAGSIYKNIKALGKIEYAVLSKGFVRGRKSTALDVDLFVVGEIAEDLLNKLVKEEESRIGKEINFSVMTPEEFLSRKRTGDQFVERFMSQSRIMLVGDEEKFCALV